MIAVKYSKVKYCSRLWSNDNPSLSPSPLLLFIYLFTPTPLPPPLVALCVNMSSVSRASRRTGAPRCRQGDNWVSVSVLYHLTGRDCVLSWSTVVYRARWNHRGSLYWGLIKLHSSARRWLKLPSAIVLLHNQRILAFFHWSLECDINHRFPSVEYTVKSVNESHLKRYCRCWLREVKW